MARVIVINKPNTFAHLYLTATAATRDLTVPRTYPLEYFFENGVPLAQPATLPTPQHLETLQTRLRDVKEDLLQWINDNPGKLGNGEDAMSATELVNTYVQNGVVSLDLFRAYPIGLPHHRGNFIHNWLHH